MHRTTPGFWHRQPPQNQWTPYHPAPANIPFSHPPSHGGPQHTTPALSVRPYTFAIPQYVSTGMHPLQYSTPFAVPQTIPRHDSSAALSTVQNSASSVAQHQQHLTYQHPSAETATFPPSAQKLPPPTNLFAWSNNQTVAAVQKPESQGRKTKKDSVRHQNLVQDVMLEFFATGQNLNLYNFCRSVKGYEDVYDSVRRCIIGNTKLKSVRDAQCKTEGFNDRLSDMAIREVLGEVECISQELLWSRYTVSWCQIKLGMKSARYHAGPSYAS